MELEEGGEVVVYFCVGDEENNYTHSGVCEVEGEESSVVCEIDT